MSSTSDIRIQVWSAKEIVNKALGRADLYVAVKCQGQIVRTDTHKDVNSEADWSNEILEHLQGIHQASVLTVELSDVRFLLRDRILGRATISLAEIMKKENGYKHRMTLIKHGDTERPRAYVEVSFHVTESKAQQQVPGPKIMGKRPEKGVWLFGETEKLGDKYKLEEKLGEGAFGVTKVAIDKKTGEKFACKTISKSSLTSQVALDDQKKEIEVMYHLVGNSNVVNLKEVMEDAHSVHIIMELCTGGNLYSYITKSEGYTEKDVAWMMKGIMSAVQHCHAMNVLHRDIKPENFLIEKIPAENEKPKIKITDFGLSTFARDGQRFQDILGTCYYIAPEVLDRNSGAPADVWSCGIVMYVLLSGVPPFNGYNEKQIFRAIKDQEPDFDSEHWQLVSPQGKALLKRMLNKDPRQRPTAAKVLDDVWFSKQGARSTRLAPEILKRLQRFGDANKLKKQALIYLAQGMPSIERAGLMAMFADIDNNHDDSLSKDELAKAIQTRGGVVGPEQMEELFKGMDLDGNGKINQSEFMAASLKLNKLASARLHEAFAHFDLDDDKRITKQDLQQALPETASTEAQAIIDQVGKSPAEGISYDEFRVMLQASNSN